MKTYSYTLSLQNGVEARSRVNSYSRNCLCKCALGQQRREGGQRRLPKSGLVNQQHQGEGIPSIPWYLGLFSYISLIRKTHFIYVLGKCFHLYHPSLLQKVTQNVLALHASRTCIEYLTSASVKVGLALSCNPWMQIQLSAPRY